MPSKPRKKALTGLYAANNAEIPRVHSVGRLLDGLAGRYPELTPYRDMAAILDSYYIGTRYPTGALGQIPGKNYTPKNAQDAEATARGIVDMVQQAFGKLIPSDD